MNHKDVISTCPINEDFYEKIRDITKEWAGMYKEKNTRTLDGESWDLSIVYSNGRKRISSGMNTQIILEPLLYFHLAIQMKRENSKIGLMKVEFIM